MLYGAPEVPRQEREPVGRVIHIDTYRFFRKGLCHEMDFFCEGL
jgi:hypothetical protein